MSASLDHLPAELLERIASFLSVRSQSRLRLTSKNLRDATTGPLFRSISLYPTKESRDVFEKVSESPELAKCVRCIRFYTEEKDFESDGNMDHEPPALDYINTLKNTKFTNLKSLSITFDQRCWEDAGEFWQSTYAESLEFRTEFLKEILNLLLLPQYQSICNLSIKNLQNVNDNSLVTSTSFKQILERLHTLRLFVCTETEEAAPEHSIEIPAVHYFWREFPFIWAQPTTSHLTHLSLYMDTYFGYAPKLDLRGVHFPALRNLELGNYVFSHDWQLDWIISHAQTLTSLSLDDCPILFLAISHWTLDDEKYPIIQVRAPTQRSYNKTTYQYNRKWHEYFNHFSNDFPLLRSFNIGASNWQKEKQLDGPIRLHRQSHRYIVFDSGIGPTQWIGTIYKDKEGPRSKLDLPDSLPEFAKEDKDALLALWRKIGQAVPSSVYEELMNPNAMSPSREF